MAFWVGVCVQFVAQVVGQVLAAWLVFVLTQPTRLPKERPAPHPLPKDTGGPPQIGTQDNNSE
jgi:hypothetical protein